MDGTSQRLGKRSERSWQRFSLLGNACHNIGNNERKRSVDARRNDENETVKKLKNAASNKSESSSFARSASSEDDYSETRKSADENFTLMPRRGTAATCCVNMLTSWTNTVGR